MKTLRELGSERNLALKIRELVRENLRVIVPAAVMSVVMVGFYLSSTFIEPGIVTFTLSLVALSMVIVTSLARVNDIGRKAGWNWGLRRIALITIGASAVGILLSGEPPAWRDTMLHLGLALTWFTTPGMPPWWKYIAGKDGDDSARIAQ